MPSSFQRELAFIEGDLALAAAFPISSGSFLGRHPVLRLLLLDLQLQCTKWVVCPSGNQLALERAPVIGGDVEKELRWEGMAVLGPQVPLPVWVSSCVCSVTIKAQKCWWEGASRGLLTNLPPSMGWEVGISPWRLGKWCSRGLPLHSSQQQSPLGAHPTWMLMRRLLTR